MLSEQQRMLLLEATIHLACSTFKTSPCLVRGFHQSTSEWATPEEWEQLLGLLFPRDYMMSAVSYLRDIETTRKKYNIPLQLILNADQTPSLYVSVGKSTMAKHGDKSVSRGCQTTAISP